MQGRLSVPLFLLAVVPRLSSAQAPPCADATITGDRVGLVRIGMPLNSVRARCPILRDTTEINEGESARVVYALVAGDTLRIALQRNSVWLIAARRPRFATKDSIRAGMPLSRFLVGRQPEIRVGEGKVYLLDRQHCGNSFGLSAEAYRRVPQLTGSTLSRLPRSTVIDEILVIGTATRLPNQRCS